MGPKKKTRASKAKTKVVQLPYQSPSIDWLLFTILLITFAYFFQGASDNPISHMDTTLSMAFERRLSVTHFSENTTDVVGRNGYLYSIYPPGAAITALPVNVLLSTVWDLEFVLRHPWAARWAVYLGTLLSVSLLSALSALCFRRLMILLNPGLSPGQSLMFSLAAYLGTLILPYSTVLFGQMLAGAFLVLGVYFAILEGPKEEPRKGRLGLAAFSLGWAVLCEYSALAVALPLAVALFWQFRDKRAWGMALPWSLLPLPLALAVNHTVFGNAWHFAGIGWPNPFVALQLFFGAYRGLFIYCPVLLLALAGFLRLRSGPYQPLAIGALSGVALLWVVNSGFPDWHGGSSFGPRYLVPAIPFLALGFAFAPMRKTFRTEFAVLGVLSVFICGVATVTTPFVDVADPLPLLNTYPQLVRAGGVSRNPMGLLTPRQEKRARSVHPELHTMENRNWGETLGLRGFWSLIPLALLWALFGGLFVWRARRARLSA